MTLRAISNGVSFFVPPVIWLKQTKNKVNDIKILKQYNSVAVLHVYKNIMENYNFRKTQLEESNLETKSVGICKNKTIN